MKVPCEKRNRKCKTFAGEKKNKVIFQDVSDDTEIQIICLGTKWKPSYNDPQ